MHITSINGRDAINLIPEEVVNICNLFSLDYFTDYELINPKLNKYIVLVGNNKKVPILNYLLNLEDIANLCATLDLSKSYILDCRGDVILYNEQKEEIVLNDVIKNDISSAVTLFNDYGGHLNENGEHIINLKLPSVGIHYGVNLLIGNRMGFDCPLQSTPKAVVDYLGRGSFRAHSTYQVLATSWGMLPEENGHPANRQFYLLENGQQIFYSASIDEHVLDAKCIHSQNKTIIEYELDCKLKITRTIFLTKQRIGLPCANEIQTIKIENLCSKKRNIKIVYTGMFGSSNPDTQKIDVIYSTLISQTRVTKNDNNEIVSISPDYFPEYCRREIRYCILKTDKGFADDFESSYATFVGNGSIQKPQNLYHLTNKLSLKGPNFFALGKALLLKPYGNVNVDTFTGMVDAKDTTGNDDYLRFEAEIKALINKFKKHRNVLNEINENDKDCRKYAKFLQIAGNDLFANYVNNNLPFQVYYQTFVSRAFAMTQKGYREIGFREIQDIYASMYYLIAQGKEKFVKSLLVQWISNVYKMGYANHNFYYVGKEPGMCSDDQIWLVHAIYQYISLTNDIKFLDLKVKMAGTKQKRSVYETIKNIILYSGKISIGKHGLPLLDSADWNDCLNIDIDYLNGIAKEKEYFRQLKKNNKPYGTALDSDYSESVMNAFLLVIAIKEMIKITETIKDYFYQDELKELLTSLTKNIQDNCYIDGYFVRVLINRNNKNGIEYIGSKGDKLSLDPNIDGSYYLNSFSWSLLSGVASEEQISQMIEKLEKYLKTPAGFKLCTMHNLSLAGAKGSATDQYFVGDRENGAVFKHATMMTVVAMLKTAKTVKNQVLKEKLLDNAFYMLDIVMPYRTLSNPYKFKGNPRYCTQYNNSITEENIGPVLSGTSTWLTLAIMEMLGVNIDTTSISINPSLRKDIEKMEFTLNLESEQLFFIISKTNNCYGDNANIEVMVDGNKIEGHTFNKFADNQRHIIEVHY